MMNDVSDVIVWARSRIDVCREQELKFSQWKRETRNDQPPQALIEAWTERRTLQAAMRMINHE